MKIIIGTKNAGKIAAVQKGIADYPLLTGATLDTCDVDSGVAAQPIGFEMIVSGAKNRALRAYKTGEYNLAFGIESGIFPVPYTKSGFVDTTCCAIYDGTQYHIGFSSCFEYPKKMVEKIINEGKEVADAAVDMGFSEHRDFREGMGMIGVLTKGRVSRMDYTYQSIQMALLHLENPEHYS